MAARVERLQTLLGMLQPVPADWLEGAGAVHKGEPGLTPLTCTSWSVVKAAWQKALRMRQDLEDVLATTLAVAMSTQQTGDQLFLLLIANPGSAKTRLCDALLVSRTCYPMEHLKGFHSGYNDGTGDDFSLLARSNGKTWITPEGDVMVASPTFPEIMAQIRRIFDGTSGASYKNQKQDRRYTCLRTPWIMAGTPFMLASMDQSRLGDRFLRIYIDDPVEDERRAILRRAAYAGLADTLQTSNGSVNTTLSPEMANAYRLTGGYVDHLRTNAADLLAVVKANQTQSEVERLVEYNADLAEFTADLRARPAPLVRGVKSEAPDGKELPARLVQQYGRLSLCLTAVMQLPKVDRNVSRIVTKVARDTSRGPTLDLVKLLHGTGDKGEDAGSLALRLGEKDEVMQRTLRFLENTGTVRHFYPHVVAGLKSKRRWKLTDRMAGLYGEVCGNGNW